MARTTNEFGGGEIVPSIESITGIQAPVRADFVQPRDVSGNVNTTVTNEHGISRRFQNLVNNLKSNSGIERIPFNGIDELDTEQGPNGEVVYALNTGDSRIRFVGSNWIVNSQIDTGAGNNSTNTVVRTSTVGEYAEITFYGTALNILSVFDVDPQIWNRVVDGNTTAFNATTNPFGMRNIHPSNNVSNVISAVLTGNEVVKLNQVTPVVSGLTAGVHTVRIELANGAGTDRLLVYGCEVINTNAAITQQPGADFDGRVELLTAQSFPIKPLNTDITSRNESSGIDAAFTGTTGARVLNYLTSGGQQKQVYEPAVETLNGAGSNLHTITFSAAGAGAVTLPADVDEWSILTFGAGGGGGGAAFAQAVNINGASTSSAGGGAGAGGGRSFLILQKLVGRLQL